MTAKGFIKTASVSTLAVATSDASGSINKTAAFKDDVNSAFLSGTRTIDIKAALAIVASEYEISPNPEDYIFEAIRGNTANVPNENNDAFHKNELLRFDHRLGKQVYRTYELKPHHINHRAENPKNARGFILDAHYNDAASPADECPNCGTKTASKEGRDASGIHCASCGTVVKDEFVELLIAVDRSKDPTFAQGVLSGVLKHGSMGCSCLRTRCNVCGKVAYTRSEFCSHIARGKGKEYDETEPGFNPVAFVVAMSKRASKKKVARAFEWCEGVIYDEFSRVHDPADPKAEQYEILSLNAKVAELESTDKLRNESEILTLQARVAELERKLGDKLSKTAQAAPPAPPVDPAAMPPPDPTMAAPGAAMAPPPPPPGDAGAPPVVININAPGVGVDSTQPLEETSAPPEIPIEEMTPESMNEGGPISPAAMGIEEEEEGKETPKRGASIVIDEAMREALNNLGGPSMLRFAQSYKHIKAEITSAGNVRVFDPEGTLFVVKPDRIDPQTKMASTNSEDLAKNILIMVADHGIGGTIKRTNAIVGPRLAQVLEYARDDIKDMDRIKTDSIKEEEDSDMQSARAKPDDSLVGKEDQDQKEHHEKKTLSDNTLEEREVDVEDEKNDRSVGADNWGKLNVLEMQDADTKEKRPTKNVGKDSVVTNIQVDHKGKTAQAEPGPCKTCGEQPCSCEKKEAQTRKYETQVHAARVEGIYKARFEKKVAELEKDKAEFEKNLLDRVARAMKLVARRQALNLEYSPLKMAMGIALCNKRALNEKEYYSAMDQGTAVQLIEAAFNESIIDGAETPAWEHHIDSLIERTSSVLKMGDEALMQVETDLKNIKTAMIPFDEAVVSTTDGDMDLRQAAKVGNLQLASKQVERTSSVDNKRESIRRAVGATKVASLAGIGR